MVIEQDDLAVGDDDGLVSVPSSRQKVIRKHSINCAPCLGYADVIGLTFAGRLRRRPAIQASVKAMRQGSRAS